MRLVTALAALFAAAGAANAQDLDHFETIEKAVEAAKKDKKDILVDFTGSDWCGWCIKLNEEVFSKEEFKKGASSKFVFVELDFPQRKALPDEQKKYNERMQQMHAIEGFPTILVLDGEGRAYARTGYQEGGPEAYLKHLAEFAPRKEELAKLMKAWTAAAEADRLNALDDLLAKLGEWSVAGGYADLQSKSIELKEKSAETDLKNASGKRAKYAKELALHFHRKKEAEKHAKFLKLLKELDADAAGGIETMIWIETEIFPIFEKGDWNAALEKITPKLELKGEAGQQTNYYAAVCQFRLGSKEKTLGHLETAVKLAPKTDMAKDIAKTIAQLKQ
jgi:thioredoxin-related protein